MPQPDTNGALSIAPTDERPLTTQTPPSAVTLPEPKESVQLSLAGQPVETLPRVATTDGHVLPWSRSAIVEMLVTTSPTILPISASLMPSRALAICSRAFATRSF